MNEILLVEADPATLTRRADELLADGHDVTTASSAAAARVKLPTATRRDPRSPRQRARDARAAPRAAQRTDPARRSRDAGHHDRRRPRPRADPSLPGRRRHLPAHDGVTDADQRHRSRAQRPRSPPRRPAPALHVGDLRIDRNARTATVAGELVQFTNREFELLSTLAERPNQAVPVKELHERVWGFADMRGRTSDTHLARIREKLRGAGSTVEIQGVRGFGPRLSPGQPPPADQPRAAPRTPNASPGRAARTMNRAPVTTRCTIVTNQQRSSRR